MSIKAVTIIYRGIGKMIKAIKKIAVLVVAMMSLGSASIEASEGIWHKSEEECTFQSDDGRDTAGGYEADADGAWMAAWQAQPQPGQGAVNDEIAAAVARAKAAGAGSYQDCYISGGWRAEQWNGEVIEYLRASKDENGMVVSPTNGIVMRTASGGVNDGGADKSIRLAADPSNGDLQPNWRYNPLGQTAEAPPVICMDKNIYANVSLKLTYPDESGNPVCPMNSADTSGSWVFAGNPSGSSDFHGLGGQLTGWMYRYADGSYAANGIAYLYKNVGWGRGGLPRIYSNAYAFNENGFLIANSQSGAVYIDEYGLVCIGEDGPYGEPWSYTE